MAGRTGASISAPDWARVAYEFSRGGMKYDRGSGVFGIDTRPA